MPSCRCDEAQSCFNRLESTATPSPRSLSFCHHKTSGDEDFVKVVEQWKETEEFRKLATAEGRELGTVLFRALERLIEVAGGRQARTSAPRLAYDSEKVRAVRRDINVLNLAEAELRRWARRERAVGQGRGAPSGRVRLGPVPHEVEVRLKSLAARNMVVAGSDRELLLRDVWRLKKERCEVLRKELQQMRWQRAKRWKDSLPRIWKKTPGRLYAFLRGERTAWGQAPLMGADR